ncbi:MAG TPA: TonB family protein [Myxococcota bacterium]
MARPEAALIDVLLRRPEPRLGLAVGFVVAVVAHLLVVPGAGLLPQVSAVKSGGLDAGFAGVHATAPSTSSRVELQIEPPKPAKKADDEKPEPEHDGQVVNLPALVEERPDAADYLAEQDQRTARETRARLTRLTPTPTRAPSADGVRSTSRDGADVDRAVVGKASAAGGPVGDGNARSGDAVVGETQDAGGGAQKLALEIPRATGRQGLRDTGSGQLRARTQEQQRDSNSDAFRIAMGRLAPASVVVGEGAGSGGVGRRGGAGVDDNPPGQPNLVPGMRDVERLAGLPRADHLLAEEDDATSLNTFAFRYATYFNRMADAVRVFWTAEGLRRVDPTGNIYGIEDRITVVAITLDRGGNVVDLALQDSSGVDVVDDDALQAIRRSQPYPNPPPGLFKGEPTVQFTFRFTIENGRRNAFWRAPKAG